MTKNKAVVIVSAVNDDRVLGTCLRASPDVQAGELEVVEQRGYASAAAAYNASLDAVDAEVVVFCHQDVYLPAGWLSRCEAALEWLARRDPDWGVAGVYGRTAEGKADGWVYSSGLKATLGGPFDAPRVVRTLDEVVLIVRRASGLRFDERVEGFHMYGTDLCLEAERRGLKSYVIPAFAIHNSNGIRQLPWAFWSTYLYVRRKWWDRLPVAAPCAAVTRSPVPMLRTVIERHVLFSVRRREVGRRVEDPARLHAALGFGGGLQLEESGREAAPAAGIAVRGMVVEP